MDKILVVIPYLAKEAQGSELLLAVAGWCRHFQEPMHIIIVGDRDDSVNRVFEMVAREIKLKNNAIIEYINCPRIEPIKGQYTPHLDIVHKFRAVHDAYPDAEGFIYACDDMYAVKDFNLATVKELKWKGNSGVIPEFDWHNETGWWRDLGKTRDLCRHENMTETNWVCHLPVYYEWDKLLAILDKYDCDHESYVVENLYFNKDYAGSAVWFAEHFQDEVKTSHPCLRLLGTVTWITNSNCGWSPYLEEILIKHYELNE